MELVCRKMALLINNYGRTWLLSTSYRVTKEEEDVEKGKHKLPGRAVRKMARFKKCAGTNL